MKTYKTITEILKEWGGLIEKSKGYSLDKIGTYEKTINNVQTDEHRIPDDITECHLQWIQF